MRIHGESGDKLAKICVVRPNDADVHDRDRVNVIALAALEARNPEIGADKIGELCRDEAAARGVLVEVESTGLVPPVEADGIQIEQVLINLVANAIDAAAERSDARGRVTMRVAAKDNAITLRVEEP